MVIVPGERGGRLRGDWHICDLVMLLRVMLYHFFDVIQGSPA